ncbi:MAG: recombinase family protein, partial [Rhodospirillales bacterium]|nr:recombinase family protein [Rhodospirillales bacterium]
MKTVAYVRVSTPQQDLRSQRLAILEYARAHDFRVDDFIEATASGQASEKRRRLHELTSILEP